MTDMGPETNEFIPEINIEKIAEMASDVLVYGKFPPETTINGIKTQEESYGRGGYKTLNAQTGEDMGTYIKGPEAFDDIFFRNWFTNEENGNTMFLSLSIIDDDGGQEFERIQFRGVEQPNKSIDDDRSEFEKIQVVFQFDIPKNERDLFFQLLKKDRNLAPERVQKLLDKIYGGLISRDETRREYEKGIRMKPVQRVVIVDDTFTVDRGTFIQSNPKRVFPPPSET